MKPITRTCLYCKKAILITVQASDYIFTAKRFVHKVCFENEKMNLRRGPWTKELCTQYCEDCLTQTIDISKSLIGKRNEHQHIEDHKKHLDQFYDYIKTHYDVAVIPKSFFIKIASIENGTHKTVTRPIPVTHLSEMLIEGKAHLERVFAKARQRGLDLHGINRVNYDLAVLLNSYDSFLAKKLQVEKETVDTVQRINERSKQARSPAPPKQKEKKGASDLSSIIDEI